MSGCDVSKRDPVDLNNKRLLIIKPSSLGDVVHTLPVVHAIKRLYPSCHIGWIIQNNLAGLIEHDPAVSEIIPISIPSTSEPGARAGRFLLAASATLRTLGELGKRFSANPYDWILDLHASFRSGLLGMMNPGGKRIGLAEAKELNTRFQDILLDVRSRMHAVDKNLCFAEFFGCILRQSDFRVIPSDEARERVGELLTEWHANDGKIIYANPATRWATKFWTVEGWAKLADRLIDEGYSVVFSGGRDDVPHIQKITGMMNTTPIIAAGRLNLTEATALLEKSYAYVGVDSGPMHIAAFTGTRVIALFGPTDPRKVGPYGGHHTVLRKEDLDCLACRKRSCSNRKCLETISPEEVFEKIRRS